MTTTSRRKTQSGPTLIGSVQRALRLLNTTAEHGPMSAKQLARAVQLPLPTTYHLLRTLVHEGYLRHHSGEYSRPAAPGAPSQGVTQWVERLAQELDVAAYFAVYRAGEVEVVAMADAPGAPLVEEWADFNRTAHAHAVGQCLLAQLRDDERRDHLARHPVVPLTPYTLPDQRALQDRLRRRAPGSPVIEREEYTRGTVCAAVPITVGRSAAALALAVPAARGRELGRLAGELCERAEQVLLTSAFAVGSS
ncbi:IclR family transcriptional regulator [Streptomyces monticola]|uniref:IclR family transcriptional regulator n=1 Tax=Streptomyces monticola TaxID=2666263 RepID=A0ABW2JBT3_9ACTN